MATSKLSLPSRKFFASDIVRSRKTCNTTKIDGLNVWEYSTEQLSVVFSVVWIQGNIVEVRTIRVVNYPECWE